VSELSGIKAQWICSILAALVMVSSLQAQSTAVSPSLEQGFASPPDSAKPYTWWHWVNGDVSKRTIVSLQTRKKNGT
jgi:hypothetical protein